MIQYEIRAILAPTDFSEHSFAAIEYARMFAERWGAELHLLNIVEPAVMPTEAGITPIGVMNLDEELETAAQENIRELAARPDLSGLTVYHAVAHGRASSSIIDYARENDIDLIVIATHGRTGLEHLIFGSTAERVVREAPCPVLTVRPQPEERA